MDRRKILKYIGIFGISATIGCLGGQETENGEQENGEHEEEIPEGVSEDEFEHGPVPQQYRTATDNEGNNRDPQALIQKDSVSFGEASQIEQAGEGETCDTCAHYIPDKNGDGFGACTQVEGYIGPEDWCSLWEPIGHNENHQ